MGPSQSFEEALDAEFLKWLTEWKAQQGPEPDALFHYTSGEGLKGIVDKGSMWATDVRFLNDESEWAYARELIGQVLEDFDPGPVPAAQKLLESLRKEIPQGLEKVTLWAVCFCTKGNLLSMWRNYAGTAGYAIEFDPHMYILRPGDAEVAYARVRVVYKPEVQRDILQEAVAAGVSFLVACSDGLTPADLEHRTVEVGRKVGAILGMHLVGMKHPDFEEENEWRFVIMSPFKGNDLPWKIEYRTSPHYVVPYLAIGFRGLQETYSDRLPIRLVRHGPTRYPMPAKVGLRGLLDANGFGGVDVDGSQTPLRQ